MAHSQFRVHALIKLVKHDVNDDRIRIDAIDTGRINDSRPKIRVAEVSPTAEMIREEPPNELEQMGTGNIRDSVPKDAASGVFGGIGGKIPYVLHVLRIEMNFPSLLEGKAFNLFNGTEFRAVAPVEKW